MSGRPTTRFPRRYGHSAAGRLNTLISLLRQLRAGYTQRPGQFPSSIVLCGVRDLRDYRIHASSETSPITGGSAFNIKAKSLRRGDFDQQEVSALLLEHTQENRGHPPAPSNLIRQTHLGDAAIAGARGLHASAVATLYHEAD